MNKLLLLAVATGCLATFLACRQQNSSKQHEDRACDITEMKVLIRAGEGSEQDKYSPKVFETVSTEKEGYYYIKQQQPVDKNTGKLQLYCRRVGEEKIVDTTYPVFQLEPYPQLTEKAEECHVYLWENGELSSKTKNVKKQRDKNTIRSGKDKNYIVVGRIYIIEKDKTYDVVIPAAGVDDQGKQEG